MGNLFESAIEDNETNMFFRGEGRYFVPSPDYEGHVHGAHMGGHARTYADRSESNSTTFDKAFLEFLKSLSVTEEDLDHLLANLSAYYSQRSRGGFSFCRLFDDPTSIESILLKDYLVKVGRSSFSSSAEDQIARHAAFLRKKGYSLLSNIIEK